MHKIPFIPVLLLVVLISCKGGISKEAEPDNSTPVTLTHVQTGALEDVTELNATSSFRLKSFLKSPVNGYLQAVNVVAGDCVRKGQVLFTVQTKEASSLGTTLSQKDSTFRFNGTKNIIAPCAGYIAELNFRTGDYVQDGETLASVSDLSSLEFILDLPYSLKSSLSLNKTLTMVLPGEQKITGILIAGLPTVDMVSQTQRYRIRVNGNKSIPENLIARVFYVRKSVRNAVSLPKEAILTNEIQSEFWIMKMISKNKAVKVLIEKGLESNDLVEIRSPKLVPSDQILLTGNYGLPDTANVTIENASR
jgi:multidrug efflux pump subunit AcrA (membrane-fusion protein)